MIDDNSFKVSFSSLDTYKTCQRKYFYNYVLKLPKIDRPWFLFGNFNHLILEKFFKYVIYFNKRGIEFNRKDLMYRAFHSAQNKFDRLHRAGKQAALSPNQIKESKKILKKFFAKIRKAEADVFAVEKEIRIELGDGMYLVGYIDRIDKIAAKEYLIVDYKTSKNAYDINKNNQLDIYALGLTQALGEENITIYKQLDFIKAGKTQVQVHNDANNPTILSDIQQLSSEIRTKKQTQSANREAWLPHDNEFCWACDFKDTCYKDRGIEESLFGDD